MTRRLVSMPLCSALLALAAPSHADDAREPPPAPNTARATPDPPPATEPEAALPPSTNEGWSGSVEAGKAWRSLYGIPIDAYDFRATLGPGDALRRHFLPAVFVSALFGRTEAGLGVDHGIVGGRFEARSRYVYAGLSAGAGYFRVKRADGEPMRNFDLLIELFLGPQVPLGDHVVLALEGRVTAELLPGDDSTMVFGPGLALRVMFY